MIGKNHSKINWPTLLMKKTYCPVQTSIDKLPYPYTELQDLLRTLSQNEIPSTNTAFPKGTLTQDGRLDMCKQNLGAEGCAFVVEALWGNDFVHSLLLGTDSIGDVGAQKVAQLINHNKKIQTVYLGCNHITSEGLEKLCDSISKSESVNALWLKRNPIGTEGALHLAKLLQDNQTLRTLDLTNTLIEDAGLAPLCESLIGGKNILERLYLSGNFLGVTATSHLAKLLRKNSTLKALHLSVNHFEEEGGCVLAGALAENKWLEELSLASCGLAEKAMVALLESLTMHPKLLSLDLGYSPSTKVLGASANTMNDMAAGALAEFLKKNKKLVSINLVKTGLSERGKEIVFNGLVQNNTLQQLTLDGRQDPHLKECLEKNKKLHFTAMFPAALQVSEDAKRIRSVYR